MTDLLDKPRQNVMPAGQKEGLPVVSEIPSDMLSAIVMLAKDPSVDVSKLGALVEMQERMEKRQAEKEFSTAFIRLAPRLPRIKKNGTLEYPVDKNKPDGEKRKIANFAKFEDIDEAIRPIISAEGFATSFNTTPRQGDGGGLLVTCTLRHEGGHSTETSIPVPLDSSGGKNNLQGYGSTLSYGKRYSLCAALNIITEGADDDGAKGGIQYIGPGQRAQIKKLIEDTGTNEIRFLEAIGVAEVEDIKVGEFTIAINLLNSKKAAAK